MFYIPILGGHSKKWKAESFMRLEPQRSNHMLVLEIQKKRKLVMI